MGVPGLTLPVGLPTVVVPAGNGGFDVAAALGNPSVPLTYRLFCAPLAAIGAPDNATPAIDATGMHVDSVGFWFRNGAEIQGAGGEGGKGAVGIAAPTVGGGGGGGGGAGRLIGAGGLKGADQGTDGSDGDLVGNGGAGGTTSSADGVIVDIYDGTDGGDAIQLNHAVTIDNGAGEIWGGGGGGAGGWYLLTTGGRHGGAGGDSGQPGELGTQIDSVFSELTAPGAGGYAIRYSGSGAAVFSGAGPGPDIQGTVG